MIRLKFKVTEIHRSMGARYIGSQKGRELVPCEVRTIRMQPVDGINTENETFWSGSPRGQIEITCLNVDSAEPFDLDRKFYVDFTPAG